MGAPQVGQGFRLFAVMQGKLGSMEQGPVVVAVPLQTLVHQLAQCFDLVIATELFGVV